MKQITEKEFYAKYPCITNHFERERNPASVKDEDICGFGGKMYETFGKELYFAIEMAKKDRVLTIIEGDEEEMNDDGEPTSVWYVTTGLHHINRIGYLVTEKPLNGEIFEVKLDY